MSLCLRVRSDCIICEDSLDKQREWVWVYYRGSLGGGDGSVWQAEEREGPLPAFLSQGLIA